MLKGLNINRKNNKKIENNLNSLEGHLKILFDYAPDAYYLNDLKGNFIDGNKAAEKLIGYNKKELLGKNFLKLKLLIPSQVPKAAKLLILNALGKPTGPDEIVLSRKDGSKVEVEIRTFPVKINEKSVVLAIARDISKHKNLIRELEKTKDKLEHEVQERTLEISKQKRNAAKIKHLSFHDYLTGLYNRAFFEEELKRLDTSRQLPLTIAIGDVNGLKIINDSFGHKKGDELLCKIANIIKRANRSEDIVARWGGDEFIIILPKTTLKATQKIIYRIKDICKRESIRNMPLNIAFGISTKENISENITEVIKTAEDKMYRHKMVEQQSTHSSIISSLGKALNKRDYETEEHVKRIKSLAVSLGKELDLGEEKIDELNLLAVLCDIGKISIADRIILKPRSLTYEERELVKRHPEIGYGIVKSSAGLSTIAKGILYHHEWWNGKGYPKGIKGKDIPLISRIISIVDAYGAMTSDRPYRKALSREEAMEELKRCAGNQFDPDLVDRFVAI